MLASRLTWSGAPVGVSTSTQRRMPSRMVLESKGLGVVGMLSPSGDFQLPSSRARDRSRLYPSSIISFPRSRQLPGRQFRKLMSALVGAFARGDLLDQVDDAAPELGVGDAREGAGQRQTLGGREEIGNVGRRGAFGETLGAGGAGRSPLE